VDIGKCGIMVGPELSGHHTWPSFPTIDSNNRQIVPKRLQVDNGTEFASKELDRWAYENRVTLDFSRPGIPTDNPFSESFNGSFRDECLNTNWFLSLEDAVEKIDKWRTEYNHFRPHSSLQGMTDLALL
jgi:putative transposase